MWLDYRFQSAPTQKKKKILSLKQGSSVTRSGDISPLGQKFKRLTIFKGLFSIRQKFKPTLTNFLCYRANFHCCAWPNIGKVIYSSGHTAGQLGSLGTTVNSTTRNQHFESSHRDFTLKNFTILRDEKEAIDAGNGYLIEEENLSNDILPWKSILAFLGPER